MQLPELGNDFHHFFYYSVVGHKANVVDEVRQYLN